MDHKTISLGICLGASTISVVKVEKTCQPGQKSKPEIVGHSLYPHEGNPKQTLLAALKDYDLNSVDRITATGRKFRKFIQIPSIPEPEAVEKAYAYIKPENISCPAIVSAGGETFMVYVLNQSGRISNVITGNKCASGTGEFFLQQLRRMDVTLDEAAQWAAAVEPHSVSGRCSVFCKSDCTHAINKGIPKSKVTAGLCRMMADKILELLKKIEKNNIMITGGSARNQMMIEYLSQEISDLVVPHEAPYFEALGAALWGLDNNTDHTLEISELFKKEVTAFDTLAPLSRFKGKVEFKTIKSGMVRRGDECIIGLDVGSTTTKAVLMRNSDRTILSSVYLRTNGDPVRASRQCYDAILNHIKKHVDPRDIVIYGLGVCGSGRQIAGLHALTEGIINEIIAHAEAAVYFDPDVDTLFEIGGQDAKYTYITNRVPSDYAMNEACSAGTGSFLEESALESLGVKMEDIADIAVKGQNPPNFNDQCAAFIASDIKNAIHEGVEHSDIVAGLVYSICMNYSNRVKGNRPVGKKIFMQGGVCYNKAVPLAMAALVGKPIVVPPEPGLMGAFGVALAVKKKIDAGLMIKKEFNLKTLVNRDVNYRKPFICKGGKERCDRRCEIAMIEVDGKKYPFGGACNRYYNLRQNVSVDMKELDQVRVRQQLVFDAFGTKKKSDSAQKPKGKVGINKSFLVNTYYPLYSTFFTELGFEIVIPDCSSSEGIDSRNAAFCYPAELAHGFFHNLIHDENLDYIFLPHFKSVPGQNNTSVSQVCPLVQGETYYLQTTFRQRLALLNQKGVKLLAPLIDLHNGLKYAEKPLIETADQMGITRKKARAAFIAALKQQEKCTAAMKEIGRRTLSELTADPKKMAVILFSRPYNGFVEEANMGISQKFASRGIKVIPLDFLNLENEKSKRHMYWGLGQLITMAGKLVAKHPQLFGVYITNFSCGPDSFILGYFREIMGNKPSLTLELDSLTADAGLETRIEAFLDIVTAYRQLNQGKAAGTKPKQFLPARTVSDKNGAAYVITSSGESLALTDPRVTMLLPSMGILSTESLAAVFRSAGFNARAHAPADESILKLGRGNTSCKECLPLILTTGTLLKYINNGRRSDEIVVYFMATASGPCRFGQYSIFLEDLIKRLELKDVALFSLTSEDSYGGLGNDFYQRAWWALVIADVMEDIRSMILANAQDTESALEVFFDQWNGLLKRLQEGTYKDVETGLSQTGLELKKIPMKCSPKEVPIITVAGEIFVRRDGLSRQYLTERLAKKGFAVICSPISEWMHYSDYLYKNSLAEKKMSGVEKMGFLIKQKIMKKNEKRIKELLSVSGLNHADPIDIHKVIANAAPYMSPNLSGEAVLTIGTALTDIASHACGVIAIGPFGCMPNRLSESILNETMNHEGKLATDPQNKRLREVIADHDDLPFLAVESDGSPFPQLIDAKLEAFCLRAERLHRRMLEFGSND